MKLGLPLATREKELAELKGGTGRTYDVRFQGKLRSFPVYTIRIELPKYRLENGRTSAAQRDYIATQGKPKDFFDSSKRENNEVQEAQHAILVGMAKSGDPDKDLFRYFDKRDQEQPLILDRSGFVINGNRRLSTFREINSDENHRFTHIDVVVLPKCDPKDIDELEVHLQVERDIKQEYSWISLAYALRQKLDAKQYSESKLCEIFGLNTKELRQSLQRLLLAEEYLASRNKQGRYLELEKTEYAFIELQKTKPKVGESSSKQQLFNEIAFRLIDAREGDRLYASIPEALEVLDDIRRGLEEEVLKEGVAAQRELIKKASEKDDLFGKRKPEEIDNLAVYSALREARDDKAIHAVIQNAIEAKRERDKARARGNSALAAIRAARTSLENAVNALADQEVADGIAAQLDAIEESVAKIRQWLESDKADV